MQIVLLTAFGVGGATVIGAALGFLFKKISHKFNDIVLSFAAGAMLYVVVEELIPEASGNDGSDFGTTGFGVGFILMMILDKVFG